MKKFIKILFFISLIIIINSPNFVNAREVYIDDELNVFVDGKLDENAAVYEYFYSPLYNITPNYQIISTIDKKSINGGDSVTIKFDISGGGKVVANKLQTFFPEEILKDDPIYYLYMDIWQEDENTKWIIWYDKYPEIYVGSKKLGDWLIFWNETFLIADPQSNLIFGELSPATLKINTSSQAPAGDHILKIFFFYSDGIKWYSSQDHVTIHIREWYEIFWIQLTIPIVLFIIGIILSNKIRIKATKNKEKLNQ